VGSESVSVPTHLRLCTGDYNNLYKLLRPLGYSTRQSGGS